MCRTWSTAFELLFPSTCIGCGLRGTLLCPPCERSLPVLPRGACPRCAAMRTVRGVCRGCRQLSSHLGSVRAAFAYDGAARNAVLQLKFRSGRHLAPLMGALLHHELSLRPLHADVVVPVPLAPGRLRERGYNQATLLAEHVSQSTGGTVRPDALIRRDRRAQQTLDANARLRNLKGAIACRDVEAVAGKRVILVDDVVTTGATLSACAEALARAGASRITAVAFARDL
jgi:competence protein ComFC